MRSEARRHPLPRPLALRIGLAARALPGISAAQFLRILADCVEMPPTEEKLASLTVQRLRGAAGGILSGLPPGDLRKALSHLRGEGQGPTDKAALDLPQPRRLDPGEMPDSLRVACASQHGEEIDGHFGACARFLIYQVSAAEIRLIDLREAGMEESLEEDKNQQRAKLIADCHLLYVTSIGGPAAAKVIRLGVHPLKVPQPGSATKELARLQALLAGSPPPWLRKAMGKWPGGVAQEGGF